MSDNLAHKFCMKMGKTVQAVRDEYEGSCIDFAGDLIDHLGYGRLAYFDNLYHPTWGYHAAVIVTEFVDGEVVHDLWEDQPIALKHYMHRIGARTVEYPAEDETV